MTTTESLITLKDVVKSFGSVRALDGIDCSLGASGVTGLIGPNGSGKSTLVNVASGFLRPTSGKVTFCGRDLARVPPHKIHRLGLARTFQESMVFPAMSVLANVVVAVEAAGKARATAEALLESDPTFSPLNAYRNEPAGDLPFGLGRFLGVVIALAAEPRVIMLDEPAAGLNDVETKELGGAIGRLAERGLAMVAIDHDMAFLLPLCHRVVVLDAGSVIADGTADEIRADPRVIATYLGESHA